MEGRLEFRDVSGGVINLGDLGGRAITAGACPALGGRN
jgi:hypothetical protein